MINKQVYSFLHSNVTLKQRYSSKDWLSKREEPGDTFHKFLRTDKKNRVTKERKIIYILRMDQEITDECLDRLKDYCGIFFNQIEVKIMGEDLDIPRQKDEYPVTSRTSRETKKIQLLATDILDLIESKFLPDDAYCVIGIINQDLYPKPGWNFVFGCSRLKRRTGIFSFARYSWNLEDKTEDDIAKLVIYRACKTMTHEIGHMFGVRHCIYHECLMNGSNKIQEADLKPLL